jgi:hypothetical protein
MGEKSRLFRMKEATKTSEAGNTCTKNSITISDASIAIV